MSGPIPGLPPGSTVLVAGLAVSGVAAAEVLLRRGYAVTVVEARDRALEQQRAAALESLGARVLLGSDAPGNRGDVDLVVTSPGWRPDHPLLVGAQDAGVPVWGEVELAWRLRGEQAAPWLALTGTNGKTTATRMLTAMLAADGRAVAAAGNVGIPLVAAVEAPLDVLVVELSSFQLHWAASVRPHAAAVLNVAPDHLDWHGSLAAYALDKHRIWGAPGQRPFLARGQDGGWELGAPPRQLPPPEVDVAVGNADDPLARVLWRGAHARRRVSFTLGPPASGQLGVVEGLLVDRAFGPDPDHEAQELALARDVRPEGPHNVANALAAAALARSVGVAVDSVRGGLAAVRPDPHRNALVAELAGVRWVDDSKATNPHAAAASLAGYDPVVWVAGGLAKGLDVDELVRSAAGRLRAAVLLGRDRERFATALARHAPEVPVVQVDRTDTGVMDAVVTAAAGLARPGDTVLLAPACASMDLFRDYGQRGDAFVAAVRARGAAG